MSAISKLLNSAKVSEETIRKNRQAMTRIIEQKLRNQFNDEEKAVIASDAYKNFHDALMKEDVTYATMVQSAQQYDEVAPQLQEVVRNYNNFVSKVEGLGYYSSVSIENSNPIQTVVNDYLRRERNIRFIQPINEKRNRAFESTRVYYTDETRCGWNNSSERVTLIEDYVRVHGDKGIEKTITEIVKALG
jgi:hypothetical protein